MLAVEREVVRSSGPAWGEDDELDLDLDDEPISEPRSEVCGGVTSFDDPEAGSPLSPHSGNRPLLRLSSTSDPVAP